MWMRLVWPFPAVAACSEFKKLIRISNLYQREFFRIARGDQLILREKDV